MAEEKKPQLPKYDSQTEAQREARKFAVIQGTLDGIHRKVYTPSDRVYGEGGYLNFFVWVRENFGTPNYKLLEHNGLCIYSGIGREQASVVVHHRSHDPCIAISASSQEDLERVDKAIFKMYKASQS